MAKLVFIDKNFSGRVYELVLEKTTVGRGDQNTLVIHDGSLSASHCEILMHGGEIIVRDLDSRNGTFVAGVRLNKQAQVKSGQTVRFGSVEARLELGPSRDETDTAEITAVYALGKVMREQRRAEKQPKPANPKMELDPEQQAVPEEQTILMPRAARPHPSPILSAPAEAERPVAKCSKGKLAIIAGLAVIGLIVLLWLVFR